MALPSSASKLTRSSSLDAPPLSLSGELQCSICLEMFTDPVTTPCGHNFCKNCLNQCWNNSQTYNCPYCKETFSKRPDLKINTALREIVLSCKGASVQSKSEVLCDICDDVKMKALKMCLDCQSFYCETHLEPHLRVPNLKKHKLIDSVENPEKYMCQKHRKALELFCRDDQTCVCLVCGVTDHKSHNTVPVEEESRERKPHLKKIQTDVQSMMQDRIKKMEDIRHLKEVRKESSEKEKAESMELFTDLIRSFERCQSEMLEMMEQRQRAAEKEAEGLMKDLEQEITELRRRDSELEQLTHSEDHLRLLQIYPSLSTPPHTSSLTHVSISESQLSMETVREKLTQLQETLDEKLKITVQKKMQRDADVSLATGTETPFASTFQKTAMQQRAVDVTEEVLKLQQYAVDVTLDPDTAHPNLILSNDGKQVSYTDIMRALPDNPRRFNFCPCVLAKEGFSSGRFYFEVQVKGKTDWDVGVARESINSKGIITGAHEDGFWIIMLRNNIGYLAIDSPATNLDLKVRPQVVGVFVDYEKGLVSFYDVESSSLIHSFTGQSFTEKLVPYFSPFFNKEGGNEAPLVIRHIERT